MDTLTHALSGALLARATMPDAAHPNGLSLKARTITGAAAAAFPDIDVLLRALDTLVYLDLHQGYTHSLVLLPLWALGLAVLFSRLTRQRYGWRAFYGVAALGLAIHIAGDMITAYGTQLFSPLSDRRFTLPIAFVIDPYLTAIIVAALFATMLFPGKRRVAGAGLAMLALYLVFLGVLRESAIGVGAAHAQRQNLHPSQIQTLPQPLSPFHWQIIVGHGEHYQVANVNLLERNTPWPGVLGEITQAYRPAASAHWQARHRYGATPAEIALAREAWFHPALAGFRRFALYPALDHIAYTNPAGVCVWFVDQRFVLPAVAPSFRFGLCRHSADGAWQLRRLQGNFVID